MYRLNLLLVLVLAFAGCDDDSASNNSSNVNNTSNTGNVNNINNTTSTNNVNNTGNTNNVTPVCGDGVIDAGEVCDGTALGGATCDTLGLGFEGGVLSCSDTCTAFDTSACTLATGDSSPTPDATVLQSGSGGVLLRGTVLTPTGILSPGEVLIIGDTITCVAADCTQEAQADSVTWVETNGIISPGLIDSHNHMSYNFLPEWVPTQLYQNRYQWADEPDYEEFILPYSAHRSANSHFCPASKWGELRSLVHGTTTMQGQPSASGSCINGWVRNANLYHGLGYDHMRGTTASVRDLTDSDAQTLVDAFESPTEPTTRYHVHMAEGFANDNILEEFDSYAGRDPRTNRHAGVNLTDWGTTIMIHAIPLTTDQITEVAASESKIVWSPSSNIALYGVTAPIQAILQAGILVGLGPDWTPSGEDDMIAEMRYAHAFGQSNAISELTSRKIWEMSTMDGAEVLGLGDYIGRLEAGMRADVVVIGRTGVDPYGAIMDARPQDVRLVFINGEGFYGDAQLQALFQRNDSCESFVACGTAKFICVSDPDSSVTMAADTYVDIRTQLYNILEGIGYPVEEQYGRGDELLELISCP